MQFKERVVIFDLEATCHETDRSYPKEIIEIGAIDSEGVVFNSFIKPIKKPCLTDFCKKLTSIHQEDINKAKGFKQVYPDFNNFFQGATLVSWGNYDKNQLLKDLRLNKLYADKEYIEANHVNLKEFFEEVTGKRAGGMKGALHCLGLNLEGTHHRGIDDARNILKIYNKLLLIKNN